MFDSGDLAEFDRLVTPDFTLKTPLLQSPLSRAAVPGVVFLGAALWPGRAQRAGVEAEPDVEGAVRGALEDLRDPRQRLGADGEDARAARDVCKPRLSAVHGFAPACFAGAS
jgi:hypothetical protein